MKSITEGHADIETVYRVIDTLNKLAVHFERPADVIAYPKKMRGLK